MPRNKRFIEIFSAGCPACNEAVELVNTIVCPSCQVTIHDMNNPETARRAQALGVRRVPAVVIDGKLAGCCIGSEVTETTLRSEGVGQPL